MNKVEAMSETMNDTPANTLTGDTAEAQGYHYNVMRRALDRIDAAGGRIPLEALAAELHMSPAHFQRLFSAWVGVSPKRYQQYLTLDHARTLLSKRHTVLETAQNAGLSGSGRLHDLFLRWEAMSPGDFARRAAGLTIRYGWFASPFGEALAMGTDKGLCGLAFAEECGHQAAWDDMAQRWPEARFLEGPDAISPWVEAAFAS